MLVMVDTISPLKAARASYLRRRAAALAVGGAATVAPALKEERRRLPSVRPSRPIGV
jgi:hypothetical protein